MNTGTIPHYRPIIHHSIFDGEVIRQDDWKLIPSRKQLFNIREDIEEMINRYDERPDKVAFLQARLDAISTRVNDRNKRTNQGKLEDKC